MKTDIILSGVGGQGILSIAAVIGEAALKEGLYSAKSAVNLSPGLHDISVRDISGFHVRFF